MTIERSSPVSDMTSDQNAPHETPSVSRFTRTKSADGNGAVVHLHDDTAPHAPVPAWRQRRRNRILAAATELFATRPYPLVSMDEVADTARMGKATLYRYFPSKEDLYVAVFDLVLDELNARLDAATAEGGGPSLVLRRMIGILVPALGDHFRGLRTIDDGVMHAAERKRRLFRNRRHVITGHVEETIMAGIESGEFRGVRAATCAHMIVGMIWSLTVNSTNRPTWSRRPSATCSSTGRWPRHPSRSSSSSRALAKQSTFTKIMDCFVALLLATTIRIQPFTESSVVRASMPARRGTASSGPTCRRA